MKYFERFLALSLAALAFLVIYTIPEKSNDSNIIKYVRIVESEEKLSTDQKAILVENLEFVSGEFSRYIISYLEEGCRVAKKWKQSGKHELNIFGFEYLSVSNEKLAILWSEKYYPKHWIEGNVRSINYFKTVSRDKVYGKDFYYSGRTEDFKHLVNFFASPDSGSEVQKKKTEEATKTNLDWTFSHELGHNNDWVNATYLSPRERIELLAEVARAYSHPQSFKSVMGYVDSIENEDKFKQKYYRTREWWGTVCEWYFTFPDLLRQRSEKDFRLVDKWVRKRDPQYDTQKMQREREKLLKKIIVDSTPLQKKN